MRLGGWRFVQQVQARSRSPPSRTRLSHSSEVQDGNCQPSVFKPPPASARRHQEDTGPLGTRGSSGHGAPRDTGAPREVVTGRAERGPFAATWLPP